MLTLRPVAVAPARAAGRAPPTRCDLAFVALVAVLAVVEALLRPDLEWRWLSLATFLVWLPTLLVRRTRPLLMAVVFAAVTAARHGRSGGRATDTSPTTSTPRSSAS